MAAAAPDAPALGADARGPTLDVAADGEDPPCPTVCPLAQCGADDSCGGVCAACPSDVSCPECALRLEIVDAQESGGVVTRLTLALVFDPPEGAVLPTSAEVRLRVQGVAKVLGLEVGPPIGAAHKQLAADPQTGGPFQLGADGTVRVVVLSTDQHLGIGAGTWWTWDVRLGGAFEPPTEPVVLSLIRDGDPMFAPPGAEAVVADPATGDPVVVWPP